MYKIDSQYRFIKSLLNANERGPMHQYIGLLVSLLFKVLNHTCRISNAILKKFDGPKQIKISFVVIRALLVLAIQCFNIIIMVTQLFKYSTNHTHAQLYHIPIME